jgi:hypothetical protein
MKERETEVRKAAACRSFWSDDPLNLAYRDHTGRHSFTLRAFVAFVVGLPQDRFEFLRAGRV